MSARRTSSSGLAWSRARYSDFLGLKSFCSETKNVKVRHLVANLEREAINLAHIWPKTYSSLEDGKEKICCYWFIGLKLDMEGGKGGQLDLTTPIKVSVLFSTTIYEKRVTKVELIFLTKAISGIY